MYKSHYCITYCIGVKTRDTNSILNLPFQKNYSLDKPVITIILLIRQNMTCVPLILHD